MKRKLRASRPDHVCGDTTPQPVFAVRRDVMATAMRLAGGDKRRIVIEGTDRVLVANRRVR
jgi:hypothetical protein